MGTRGVEGRELTLTVISKKGRRRHTLVFHDSATRSCQREAGSYHTYPGGVASQSSCAVLQRRARSRTRLGSQHSLARLTVQLGAEHLDGTEPHCSAVDQNRHTVLTRAYLIARISTQTQGGCSALVLVQGLALPTPDCTLRGGVVYQREEQWDAILLFQSGCYQPL